MLEWAFVPLGTLLELTFVPLGTLGHFVPLGTFEDWRAYVPLGTIEDSSDVQPGTFEDFVPEALGKLGTLEVFVPWALVVFVPLESCEVLVPSALVGTFSGHYFVPLET